MVDLGGSLAVASRGLFATGVSTDLNVTYLNSGGKIGDIIRAEVTCDKCEYLHTYPLLLVSSHPPKTGVANGSGSWQDTGLYFNRFQEREG